MRSRVALALALLAGALTASPHAVGDHCDGAKGNLALFARPGVFVPEPVSSTTGVKAVGPTSLGYKALIGCNVGEDPNTNWIQAGANQVTVRWYDDSGLKALGDSTIVQLRGIVNVDATAVAVQSLQDSILSVVLGEFYTYDTPWLEMDPVAATQPGGTIVVTVTAAGASDTWRTMPSG